jgi:hypothetical protein
MQPFRDEAVYFAHHKHALLSTILSRRFSSNMRAELDPPVDEPRAISQIDHILY